MNKEVAGVLAIVIFLFVVLGVIAWMGRQGYTYAHKADIWRLEERIEKLEQAR